MTYSNAITNIINTRYSRSNVLQSKGRIEMKRQKHSMKTIIRKNSHFTVECMLETLPVQATSNFHKITGPGEPEEFSHLVPLMVTVVIGIFRKLEFP